MYNHEIYIKAWYLIINANILKNIKKNKYFILYLSKYLIAKYKLHIQKVVNAKSTLYKVAYSIIWVLVHNSKIGNNDIIWFFVK